MPNPFPMIKADLKRNLSSSVGILLLLSLACSLQFAASFLVRSIMDSFSEAASGYDLVIGAAGSRTDLVLGSVYLRTDNVLPLMDYDIYEEIAGDERAAASSPLIFSDSYGDFLLAGVSDQIAAILTDLRLEEGEWFSAPFQAVVGSEVPLSVGDEFESSHSGGDADHGHGHNEYQVTGRLAYTGTPWDKAVLVRYDSLWLIHGQESGGVSAVLVKPADFASAYALRSEYREGATTAAFPAEVLTAFFAVFSDAASIADMLCYMIQVIVAAAAVISLLVSLPSKYRQIGVLRALGASRGYIFFSIWFSSALIFLISGALGVGLGYSAAEYVLSRIGSSMAMRMTLSVSSEDLLPLLVFYLIGFAGSLAPSAKGFLVSPREVLLH